MEQINKENIVFIVSLFFIIINIMFFWVRAIGTTKERNLKYCIKNEYSFYVDGCKVSTNEIDKINIRDYSIQIEDEIRVVRLYKVQF